MTKCDKFSLESIIPTTNYSSNHSNYKVPLSNYSLESLTKPEHRLESNRIPNFKDLYQKSPSYSGNISEAPLIPTSPKPSKSFSASSVYDRL